MQRLLRRFGVPQHAGERLLRRCAGRSAGAERVRRLPPRPRRAAHQRGLHRQPQTAPDLHQHGRRRPGVGRCLHRAAVALHTDEDIHLPAYADGQALHHGLEHRFAFSNHARPHSALDGRTPAEVHGADAESVGGEAEKADSMGTKRACRKRPCGRAGDNPLPADFHHLGHIGPAPRCELDTPAARQEQASWKTRPAQRAPTVSKDSKTEGYFQPPALQRTGPNEAPQRCRPGKAKRRPATAGRAGASTSSQRHTDESPAVAPAISPSCRNPNY